MNIANQLLIEYGVYDRISEYYTLRSKLDAKTRAKCDANVGAIEEKKNDMADIKRLNVILYAAKKNIADKPSDLLIKTYLERKEAYFTRFRQLPTNTWNVAVAHISKRFIKIRHKCIMLEEEISNNTITINKIKQFLVTFAEAYTRYTKRQYAGGYTPNFDAMFNKSRNQPVVQETIQEAEKEYHAIS